MRPPALVLQRSVMQLAEHYDALPIVILNVTEGGVKDLLHLPSNLGAKRRSTNPSPPRLLYL
jgi:hypothetical protein